MSSTSQPLHRGEPVRVRGERWRVVHVVPHGSCGVVELAGAEASNAGRTGRFILPFEPLDRLAGSVERPRVARPASWRRLARAVLADAVPAWQSLRAAAQADVLLLPYQLEPALAMTRGLACRFLLADEVGLGKTIQAGLIVAELLARERDARALIVTPAGLRDQWSDELRARFGIDAAVIDAAALARAAAHLPAGVNPWAIPHVAITSIDFLKRPDVIRSLEPLTWDLVAFDEAHALSGRSDRALAADLVAARARRVVIITATPHNGDPAAFERLRGLGRIGIDDPLLTFRRSRADAGLARARVTRRLPISPRLDEASMHRALASYAARVSREAPRETAAGARLATIVLERRAASSAASLARSIERRIALLGAAPGSTPAQLPLPLEDGQTEDDDEPLAELSAPGLPDTATEQRCLEQILGLARSVRVESKIAALRRLLERAGEPALVFTEYRDTLNHVASRLDVAAAVLHGGLTAAERAREARRFTHGDAPVLLATDAASEGLNLHHRCRLVVNLDVPWTPLRLEQRVGRVDRLGQQRRVHAVTFVARGTADELAASALVSRAVRADRDAPFGPADASTGLRAGAISEAARLEVVRRLSRIPRHGFEADRPAITVLPFPRRLRFRESPAHGPRSGRSLMLAVRLQFVAADESIVWETVKGFALVEAAPADRRTASIRGWFESAVRRQAATLAAASINAHEADLASLQRELHAALKPLIVRERGIVERLCGGHARLAAPLVQQGLFDRRAVRDAEARRRVMEEAAARAESRIRTLERQLAADLGDRSLIFAVTWAR